MNRKRKTAAPPPAPVAVTFNRFNPSARFAVSHPEYVYLDNPEELPGQYRSATPPAVGSEALYDATSDNRSARDLELLRPFILDMVQVCFLVPEGPGPWQPSFQVGCELMWVTVDRCEGDWPNATYHGKLRNIPIFIDPERLQIGSPVTYQLRHVIRNRHTELRDPLDSRPFLDIRADSKPWLTVNYPQCRSAYPLTAEGLRQVGRDLYDSGKHERIYLSSVDFPEEHGCDLDVRELIEDAFVARAEEVGDRRYSGA